MAKKLGEFLQEKQEPFALKVYLVERGYLKKKLYCFKKPPCNILNKSASYVLHCKKEKSTPNCSKIVRTFITKIVCFGNEFKLKKSVGGNHNVSDDDKFSSASHTTMFNSSSDSEEIGADRTFATRSVKDSNQLSPASFLEETEFDDYDDDDGGAQNHKRTQEGSSKVVHSCKQEKSYEVNGKEFQEEAIIGCKFIAHYIKNKNAVLQTEQLLFDCVREIVEYQRPTKEKGGQLHCEKFLGAEQLWELVYENILLWSKEMIVDETNVEQLVHSDIVTISLKKWSNFEEQTREISADIAATILEDNSNEIITEMIKSCIMKKVDDINDS